MSDTPATTPATAPGAPEQVTITAKTPSIQQVNPASLACYVDIYTPEGSQYSFSSFNGMGAILQLTTNKNIMERVGTFQLVLAPQTLTPPKSQNSQNSQTATQTGNLSWSQILTPMSTVIVGFQRGVRHGIVMIGLISSVRETQTWQTGRGVQRTITITGEDFGKYLEFPDYYSLFFLASTTGDQTDASTLLNQGLTHGDPGAIAKTWFTSICLKVLFANTYIAYKGGSISMQVAFGYEFDTFDADYQIPFGYYYLGSNSHWADKFEEILQPPFYEYFVTTAGYTNGINSPYKIQSQLYTFGCNGLPNDDASPVIIGRVNPWPRLVTPSSASQSIQEEQPGLIYLPDFSSATVDTSLWDALTEYTLDVSNNSFISSAVEFSDSTLANFFVINPYFATGQLGGSNQNIIAPLYLVGGAADFASIARYGFRPQIIGTYWFADTDGFTAQQQASNTSSPPADFGALYAILLGRLASIYEPLGLMARASCVTNIRPDIQIGNKFTYAPFRDQVPWTFYIDLVDHSFNFGGVSTTTLGLSRGLPKSVYEDPNLLKAILTGNAQRVNGQYQVGIPAEFSSQPTLSGLSLNSLANWIQTIQQYYGSPQATQPATP